MKIFISFFTAKSSCPSLGCEYKCQASLTGGSCYCPDGRKLASDNRTCVDKDECVEWGYCDQLCTNTDGGYMCYCAQGYLLQDKSKCIAPNANSLTLLFAHDTSIHRMNSRGGDIKIIANSTTASGLDFHNKKNLLFWSDTKTKKVNRMETIFFITANFVS